MAKVIKYKILSGEVNRGTEENPDMEQIFLEKKIICPTQAVYDACAAIAAAEAYQGEYTVEDAQDAPSPLSVEERVAVLEKTLTVPEYTAGTWYYRGDKARFADAVYTCIAPEGVVCVWSPAEYPDYWQKG